MTDTCISKLIIIGSDKNKVNENEESLYCEALRYMWKNEKTHKKLFVRQNYKPIIILNYISKKWTNIQEASS